MILAASSAASCGGGPTDDGDGSGGSDGPGGAGPDSGGSESDSGGSGSDESGGNGSDETGGGPGSGGQATGGGGSDESGGGGNTDGGETGGQGNSGGSGGGDTGGVGGDVGGLGGATSGGTGGGSNVAPKFITTWNTAATSPNPHDVATFTGDTTILLPLAAGGSYDFTVDWGDGSSSEVTSSTDPDRQHVYAQAGTYELTIEGTIEGWHFPADETDCGIDPECVPDVTSDAWKLLEISAWGPFRFGSVRGAFHHCSNLVITATDMPDLSAPTNVRDAFSGCWSLTEVPGIEDWDVSQITNMSGTFAHSAFDGDLSAWDTSNVTNMSYTFAGAHSFTADLSAWDVSSTTTLMRMFAGATLFNADVGGWDTSNVTNMMAVFAQAATFNQDIGAWDTSNVTNMSYMFDEASSFNQDLSSWDTSSVIDMAGMFSDTDVFNQDLSVWDTSSVFNMNFMFANAYAFNQDLGDWNVGSLTTAISMFMDGGLSSANYDALLIGWAAQSTQDNVPFGAGTVQYSAAAATARDVLVAECGWTITDGGLAP